MKLLIKTYYIVLFPVYYLVRLAKANLFLAWDILTPKMRINPGITRVRLEISSDFGLLLLSNLVSMTPGTLSLEIGRERKYLEVHLLYMDQREATEKDIREVMMKIKRILE